MSHNFFKEISELGDVTVIFAIFLYIAGAGTSEKYPLSLDSGVAVLITTILVRMILSAGILVAALLANYCLKRLGVEIAARFGIWLGTSFGFPMSVGIIQASGSFLWGYIAGVILIPVSFAVGYWFVKFCSKRVTAVQS